MVSELDPGESLALLARYAGIPDTALPRVASATFYDGGDVLDRDLGSRARFMVFALGLPVSASEVPEDAPWPAITPSPPDGTALQVWMMQVFTRQRQRDVDRRPTHRMRGVAWQAAAVGEVLWSPMRGEVRSIRLDGNPTDEEILRAGEAMRRVLRVVARSKPGRKKLEDGDDGWRQIVDEAEAFKQTPPGRALSWRAVARRYSVSERTMHDWRGRRQRELGG